MTTLCAGTLAVLLPNTFVLPFVDNAIIAKSSARTLVLVLVINLQWNMCAVGAGGEARAAGLHAGCERCAVAAAEPRADGDAELGGKR